MISSKKSSSIFKKVLFSIGLRNGIIKNNQYSSCIADKILKGGSVRNHNLRVGGGEFEASFENTGNVPGMYAICIDSADSAFPKDFLRDHL